MSKDWSEVLEKTIRSIIKKVAPDVADIGVIKSVKPLVVTYKGVDFSSVLDQVYANNMLQDDNINIPKEPMLQPQNLSAITPPYHYGLTAQQKTSTATAIIEGTIPEFIKSHYDWLQSWHDRYILHTGDSVICQRVGTNKLLIMSKVQKI